MSSTNFSTLFDILSSKSLIYIKNNKCPSTDPVLFYPQYRGILITRCSRHGIIELVHIKVFGVDSIFKNIFFGTSPRHLANSCDTGGALADSVWTTFRKSARPLVPSNRTIWSMPPGRSSRWIVTAFITISGPSKRRWRLRGVGRGSWGDSGARFVICISYCSEGRRFRVDGRCAGVETSPSPYSSTASPPREVGGQYRAAAWWMLLR